VVTEALELAAKTLKATAAALVVDDTVVASVGIGVAATEAFRVVAAQRATEATLPKHGRCHFALGDADYWGDPLLIVVRPGNVGFSQGEGDLVRGMSRALALHFHAARNLAAQRFSRADAESQAAENAALLTVV
jgi:hypothetical protein